MTQDDRNQLYADMHALRTQSVIGQSARLRIQRFLDDYRYQLESEGKSGEIVIFDRLSTIGAITYALAKTPLE